MKSYPAYVLMARKFFKLRPKSAQKKKSQNGKRRGKPTRKRQVARNGSTLTRSRAVPAYQIWTPPANGLASFKMPGVNSGKFTVSLCEQVAVVATAGGVYSGTGTYVIAPAVLSTRNATFATLFELAHINSCKFRWIPNASTATIGNVVTWVDYEGSAGATTTLAGASQREGAQRHALWQSFEHAIVWRDNIDRTAFVKSTSATSHRPDGQVYKFGYVFDGAPASETLGYIELVCSITYSALKAVGA